MTEQKPHKTAFLSALHENAEAPYFLIGYILKDVPDQTLFKAIQAWRDSRAELADLEDREETIRDLDGNPVRH